jgi:hypothetical protein
MLNDDAADVAFVNQLLQLLNDVLALGFERLPECASAHARPQQFSNYPITQLPNYQITQLLITGSRAC